MRLHLYGGTLGATKYAIGDEIEIADALADGYRIHQGSNGFIHGDPMFRCRWLAWQGKPVLPRPEWPDVADARLEETAPPARVIISPECDGGKCDACNGDAWDTRTDAVCDCPCDCHPPKDDEGDER